MNMTFEEEKAFIKSQLEKLRAKNVKKQQTFAIN